MATNETTNTSNTESSCKPVSTDKTSSNNSRVHCSHKARPAKTKTTESSRKPVATNKTTSNNCRVTDSHKTTSSNSSHKATTSHNGRVHCSNEASSANPSHSKSSGTESSHKATSRKKLGLSRNQGK